MGRSGIFVVFAVFVSSFLLMQMVTVDGKVLLHSRQRREVLAATDESDKIMLVDRHDSARIQAALESGIANMNKVKWNPELELQAAFLASQCSQTMVLETTKANNIGSNTVALQLDLTNYGHALNSWETQLATCDISTGTCPFSPSFTLPPTFCSKARQMLWPPVTKMGCAMADCPGGVEGLGSDDVGYVVCLYDEPAIPEFLCDDDANSLCAVGEPCTKCDVCTADGVLCEPTTTDNSESSSTSNESSDKDSNEDSGSKSSKSSKGKDNKGKKGKMNKKNKNE